ncbi:phage protease [Pectobacterium aroidearum]|uniref:phage protease n=1 Tax=Pectobacterium aroidearum TaxID=1201031 RepID=UPI0032EE975B
MNIVALCTEIKAGKKAPEWIELLPAGPDIKGRDGRAWRLTNPATVAEVFKQQGISLVIDYEHSTEVAAPNGVESPAAGWVEDVQVRDDGSVWGKVDWTIKANNSIVDKEYRFISPAFLHTPDGDIIRLSSVALTNKPNLTLTALNSKQEWDDVAIALGVDGISSPQDVLNALNRMNAAGNEKIVDEYISQAVFIPAQRDSLLAMCSRIGVEKFEEFAELQSTSSNFKKLSERTTTGKYRPQQQLTDSQIAVCRQTGVSEADYLTALGKQK